MPRLFVALDVPPAVRAALAALRVEMPGARWTPPGRLHVTLRFLGDTPDERLPALSAALREIEAPPLALRLDGLTAFPSRRAPRVLVVRLAPDDALADLQRRVEAAAQALGFEPEARPFRPHVTLARLKRADARAVLAYLRTHDASAAFAAEAFHLYASTLTPSGAVHERVASIPLRRSR